MERHEAATLPSVPYTVGNEVERAAPVRDVLQYHLIERLGWFALSLVLLGFYSFVILIGSDEDNPYELGLRAVCYGPGCLLMGIGYMLMAFVSKRGMKILFYILPVILLGSMALLIVRIYHPGVEGIFFEIEGTVGTFLSGLVH